MTRENFHDNDFTEPGKYTVDEDLEGWISVQCHLKTEKKNPHADKRTAIARLKIPTRSKLSIGIVSPYTKFVGLDNPVRTRTAIVENLQFTDNNEPVNDKYICQRYHRDSYPNYYSYYEKYRRVTYKGSIQAMTIFNTYVELDKEEYFELLHSDKHSIRGGINFYRLEKTAKNRSPSDRILHSLTDDLKERHDEIMLQDDCLRG